MILRKNFMFRVKMKSKWYYSTFHVINYERISTLDLFFRHSIWGKELALQRERDNSDFFLVHSLSWISLLSEAVRVWECNSLVIEFNPQFFQLCFEAPISYISLCSFNKDGDFRTTCSTFSTLLSFPHVFSRTAKQLLDLHQCETNTYRIIES